MSQHIQIHVQQQTQLHKQLKIHSHTRKSQHTRDPEIQWTEIQIKKQKCRVFLRNIPFRLNKSFFFCECVWKRKHWYNLLLATTGNSLHFFWQKKLVVPLDHLQLARILYLAMQQLCGSNLHMCGWNPKVWQWKLLSRIHFPVVELEIFFIFWTSLIVECAQNITDKQTKTKTKQTCKQTNK